MSTQPPSPLQLYLQSGLTASSGVDAALLNAPAGGNAPTNALTEQMQNLQLPAYESAFLPADYWDYTNPATLSQDPMQAGITATGDATGVTAASGSLEAALESFSLFGLGAVESWLLVAAGVFLLMGHKNSGNRRGGGL